jgi:tetratricopeptide (TPR) repeat protein
MSGEIGAQHDTGALAGGRLKGWKRIAAYFGTDERTVKRWEARRGLPVQRGPAGSRGTVYADIEQLRAWLEAPAAPGPSPGPGPRGRRTLVLIALLAVLVAAALALALQLGRERERSGPLSPPTPEAIELYNLGMYHWERRTPDSLRRSVDYFGQSLARAPDYAPAYAGLANAFLLLREYAGMRPQDAYPRAEAAARRALELDPGLADAHFAHAFVTFYWDRDFDAGLRAFRRGLALDPASARGHHWYAIALLHAGDPARARTQIDRAQALSPSSRSLLADKGLVLFHAGQPDAAAALLRQLAADEPEFLSPHAYLAAIHLARGENDAFIAEARVAARLVQDQARLEMLAAAERGLARGGRSAMLEAILAAQQQHTAATRQETYALAGTYALLGRNREAVRHLEAALAARDEDILFVRMDPMFRSLRDDPGFRRIAARVGAGT